MADNSRQEKYQKENIERYVRIKLYKKSDEDIINWLKGVDNIQGTMKDIIRKHISEDTIYTLKAIQKEGNGGYTVDEILDAIEHPKQKKE